MADDKYLQDRTGNSSDRTTANMGQGGDPLAELARLIGQNDPFADFGRDQRAQSQPPQRPSEAPLAPPSYFDPRDQNSAPTQNRTEQAPPAFIQAAQERSGYRDAGYRDGRQPPPDHDFDVAEPSGHGRRFMTKKAVFTLAVLGIACAIGYRMVFSESAPNAPPRVIQANPEPTKVLPPITNADASQGKSTYDRVSGPGQGERIASREESPVDVNNLPRQGGRNPPPPQGSAGQWTTNAATNMPGSTSSAPSAMGEPKRVRTVTIRPNQSDAELAQPSLTAPAQTARPAPQAPSAPTMQQRAAVSAPQPAPPQAVPPLANAPLSLNDDPPSAPVRRQAAASPPVAQPRPAPVRPVQPAQVAPAPQQMAQVAAPKGGGYLVQVSSQRSEADAQSALRTVQTKFPTVLGGQQATIRRAELGERGTFYRAMIGPFASRDQATQLCGNLKAAGGDCVVQGN